MRANYDVKRAKYDVIRAKYDVTKKKVTFPVPTVALGSQKLLTLDPNRFIDTSADD